MWVIAVQALICIVFTGRDLLQGFGSGWETAHAALVSICAIAAALPMGSRRWREAAAAATMAGAVVFIARYVGNTGGLVAINVMFLTLYQDWLPLALALVASFATGLAALADPMLFEDFASYQAEQPDVATFTRAVGGMISVLVVFLLWRVGGHLSLDPLSGLLSRNGIEQVIEHESRAGRVPTVFVFDIDGFKRLSEAMDVLEADRFLARVGRRIARIMRDELPEQSWVARVDGDAYAVATSETMNRDRAEKAAFRLLKRIEAEPVPLDGHRADINITMSAGVRCGRTRQSAGDMIAVAKESAYKAKRQGHSRVRVESPGYSRVVRPRLIASELATACRSGQLLLHYQPIVELHSGELRSAEGLLRWRHPVQGLVSASSFIKTVESDSALMADISESLMEEVFRQSKRWEPLMQRGWLPGGIAYNISAVRFQDPAFVNSVERLIEKTGVDPSRITFEVTEGALAATDYKPVEQMKQLRDMGFSLALDDFGCGYSSLAHLRDFPLNSVKIDRSFIQALERSAFDKSVVKAILEIADGSSMSVVCEGVETESQRHALLELDRPVYAQGWLWAKAMSHEELSRWTSQGSSVL